MSDLDNTPALTAPRSQIIDVLQAIKKRFFAISRAMRILVVATLVTALALGGYFFLRTEHKTYAVLYSRMERDDAATLVTKLKELKVPYKLDDGGTTVSVPADQLDELRLSLAAAGLPRGGAVGFESLEKLRLGSTEFEQKVLYRRAMEGELVRSIQTLRAIRTARVHLVMPERSVFVSRNAPSSASIVVQLHSGARLDPHEVNGIVHLVAASVADLSPARVTLVTTDGVMLHRARLSDDPNAVAGAGGAGDDGMEEDPAVRNRLMAEDLEERVQGLLDHVVGPGHADVRVSVERDLARLDRVEDHFEPSRTALRSEQQTIERQATNAVAGVLAAVPGAESNLPTGTAPAAAGGAANNNAGVVRESHTRNYEVEHVSEHRVTMGGSVKRLTVAVAIDDTQLKNGAPSDQLKRIEQLVRGAVGANDTRGDLVTVEAVRFASAASPDALGAEPSHAAVPAAVPSSARWKKYLPWAGAGAGVLALLVTLLVVRSRRRAALARERARTALAVVDNPIPTSENETEDPDVVLGRLRTQVAQRAMIDPASAAVVLRAWLRAALAAEAAQAPVANLAPTASELR